ncbi:MAG: hypothetical protein Q9160_005426 [Pyrenula sp. 1 TL-2023]
MLSFHLLLSFLLSSLSFISCQNSTTTLQLSATPGDASSPIPESFVSFSIEFAFFPDFAGTPDNPNTLSYNLLSSLANLTGSFPVIRVGGNTQDYALYDPNLQTATNGTYTSRSADYPTILSIGSPFFDSYNTWPGVQFVHGFNLAKNGTEGFNSLIATVPLACKALSNNNLAYWELGNEPDLYTRDVRPADWKEQAYVDEWLNKTRAIKPVLTEACPDLADQYAYMAPSFAGEGNGLDAVRTWEDGLDADGDIAQISIHNYIGGATQPGVTLRGTLLNHTSTTTSAARFLNVSRLLAPLSSQPPNPSSPAPLPFILGETNSLYNEGAPGLSNSFGAALWVIDFNLYCAANNVSRVHMHQGTGYRYGAWNPVESVNGDGVPTTKGTKPPFYGSLFVAAVLGDLVSQEVRVEEIELEGVYEAAYAAYVDERLARVAIVNANEYNYTVNGTLNGAVNPVPRPTRKYTLSVPPACTANNATGTGTIGVQRLTANGSDSITGIAWDGSSYNWELDDGRPVGLANGTTGEVIEVGANGEVGVGVRDSEAVILNLEC